MKYSNSWHLLPNDKVLRELSTDMYKGLSTQEVRRRRLRRGPNTVWRVKQRSAKDIAKATLFDLATLLLIIAAAAAALFDRSYEAGAIVVILVAAGVIRTVTYVRANRIFEDMAREKIPVSSVIRDGVIRIVPATEIVEGDIIFLETGDTVPCDGRVISGDDAVVSERGITENKTPVHKFNTVIKTEAKSGEVPCEFRSNMLYAGSRVLSGSIRIVAVACGKNALVSMKNGGIEINPSEKLPLVDKLHGRSKTTSLIMLACVMCLTWISLFAGAGVTLPEVFLATMAMAVAAMSEFITAIGYIIVAITLRDAADGKTDGVVAAGHYEDDDSKKTAASRIIIRDPEKLDELSKPDMAVFCGSQYFKSGRIELSAYRFKGEYRDCRKKDFSEASARRMEELLSIASAATAENDSGIVTGNSDSHVTDTAGMVSRACRAYERGFGHSVRRGYAIMDHCAPGERRSVGLDCSIVNKNGKTRLVVCGAIDTIMRCCTDIETAHGRESMSAETRREIFTECAGLEFSGARVVAIAKKPVASSFLEPAVMTIGMTFVGFFALSQETEKESNSNISSNIEFIKKSGIVPVLLTENPDSDLYYCHRFGLFNKKTVKVRATELGSVDLGSLGEDGLIVSFADIGGVYLSSAYENTVKYLRGGSESGSDEKRNVISIGMDMWDTGALKESDIGVAVSSSEYRSVPEFLSKNASVVIHPEENRTDAGFGGLSGLVRSIKYARRAVENIDSAKIFITASQTARLLLILASVFFRIPMMNAVFILIWGLLFDFFAALVMAFENSGKKDGYIRDRFRRRDEDDDRTSIYDHYTIVSMIFGAAWGIAVALVIPFAKWLAPYLGFEYSAGTGAAIMAAAVIISGIVAALESMKRGSIFAAHNPNMAQFIYIAVSLGFAALIGFSAFGAKLTGGIPCGGGIVVALIPAVLILAIAEISKIIIKKKFRS